MTTQQQKTLAIAKDMYGVDSVKVSKAGVVLRLKPSGIWTIFNPFTNAEDSQAVQEFYKLGMHPLEQYGTWFVGTYEHDKSPSATHKDLKTAIAECAYQVVMEKSK